MLTKVVNGIYIPSFISYKNVIKPNLIVNYDNQVFFFFLIRILKCVTIKNVIV